MQSDPKSKPTQESALYQLQKQSEEKKLAQQKKISYNKFLFLIYYIGKFIYQEQAQPVNKIIDDFIKDYKLLHKEQPRVMMLDDNNRQILTSPVIETLNSYEQDLKQLYTIYMAENYERQETMIHWKEIEFLNKKLSTLAFLRLLTDGKIIPNNITIEIFEDIMMRITPSNNAKEQAFYSQNVILKIFDHLGKKPITTKYEGEPMFSFFDFEMMMVRIAIEATKKEIQRNQIVQALNKFFSEIV